VLRLIVGLSAQETADYLGLTPTAVRVTQHRALAKVRNALAPSEWM
jgi:RNA polymerase sigma-70 factor (ECF subfamily)